MFTNRPALTDNAPRNVTALVLDNINTTPLQGVTARAQAMRYLRTLAPQTVTAVYLMAEQASTSCTILPTTRRRCAPGSRGPSCRPPTAWEMDYQASRSWKRRGS